MAQNYGIQNTLYVALFGLVVGFAVTFLLKETAPAKIGHQPQGHPARPLDPPAARPPVDVP